MDLKDRILKNDSRCTAQPYLLLLQEKEEYVTMEGYGHDTRTAYIETMSGESCEADTLEGLISLWNDPLEDDEKTTDWIEGENYMKMTVGYFWKTINVFFTDKGYEEHLEQNKHNLRNYRTYGIHAFRNPEMDAVLKLITAL